MGVACINGYVHLCAKLFIYFYTQCIMHIMYLMHFINYVRVCFVYNPPNINARGAHLLEPSFGPWGCALIWPLFLGFPLFSMKKVVRTYWNFLSSGWGCDTYLATAHPKGLCIYLGFFGVTFVSLKCSVSAYAAALPSPERAHFRTVASRETRPGFDDRPVEHVQAVRMVRTIPLLSPARTPLPGGGG